VTKRALQAKVEDNFSSKLVIDAFNREMSSVILDTSIAVQTEIKKLISKYGPGEPSYPGEPPHKQTGNLGRSWGVQIKKQDVKRIKGGIKASIGSNLDYAYYLEDGTIHMEARPYIEPTIEGAKIQRFIKKRIGSASKNVIKDIKQKVQEAVTA